MLHLHLDFNNITFKRTCLAVNNAAQLPWFVRQILLDTVQFTPITKLSGEASQLIVIILVIRVTGVCLQNDFLYSDITQDDSNISSNIVDTSYT